MSKDSFFLIEVDFLQPGKTRTTQRNAVFKTHHHHHHHHQKYQVNKLTSYFEEFREEQTASILGGWKGEWGRERTPM